MVTMLNINIIKGKLNYHLDFKGRMKAHMRKCTEILENMVLVPVKKKWIQIWQLSNSKSGVNL